MFAAKIPSQGRGVAGRMQTQGGVYTLDWQAAKPLPALPKEGIAHTHCFEKSPNI